MRTFFLIAFLFLGLSGCAAVDPEKDPLVLKQVSFGQLPGWGNENHHNTLLAFSRSCERILKQDPDQDFGPDGVGGTISDWVAPCLGLKSNKNPRKFFEKWFDPYLATIAGRKSEGLFTGYFEPGLRGSLNYGDPYIYPVYKRPDDLVMVNLGEFRESLKGQRIAGRVKEGRLKPYEDREKISKGLWPHNDQVIAWVSDPIDLFFLHIQGSGRIDLKDGSVMRVGYDGQNGHVYYAIGRELIKRGYMDKEDVSLQSIKQWLVNNPHEADEIMYLNKSYVFFKELDDNGSLGGEGVVLTPERSLAIDRTKLPYGVPVWVDIKPPTESEKQLQRLMFAQDTGGAIRGAVRGDVFWGYGERAAYLAGHMKSSGRYWLLLPKSIRDKSRENIL